MDWIFSACFCWNHPFGGTLSAQEISDEDIIHVLAFRKFLNSLGKEDEDSTKYVTDQSSLDYALGKISSEIYINPDQSKKIEDLHKEYAQIFAPDDEKGK